MITDIKQAQEGSEKSFNKLYKEYYNDVYNTIFYIIKDTEIANDLTSEVFIKIYQNLSMYREDISFRMWLKTIANNHCIDYIRRKKRTNEISIDEHNIDVDSSTDDSLSEMINEEEKRILYKSIEKLKEPYKTPILMRLEGRSYIEIAKELDINMGTLKSNINFAKKKLQKFSQILE